MTITQHPLRAEELLDIERQAADGLTRLQLPEGASSPDIVRTLRTYLDEHRHVTGTMDHDGDAFADAILSLAYAWGAQVTRSYGWRWAMLMHDGEDGGTYVVHPEACVCVNPVRLVYDIVVTPQRANNTALLFNMLAPNVLRGQLPNLRPEGYLDLS